MGDGRACGRPTDQQSVISMAENATEGGGKARPARCKECCGIFYLDMYLFLDRSYSLDSDFWSSSRSQACPLPTLYSACTGIPFSVKDSR
jgi:hypothetical protein